MENARMYSLDDDGCVQLIACDVPVEVNELLTHIVWDISEEPRPAKKTKEVKYHMRGCTIGDRRLMVGMDTKSPRIGVINQEEFDTYVPQLGGSQLVITLFYRDDGTYSEDVVIPLPRNVTLGGVLAAVYDRFHRGSSQKKKPYVSTMFTGLERLSDTEWNVKTPS